MASVSRWALTSVRSPAWKVSALKPHVVNRFSRRAFSVTTSRPLMQTLGFSEEQLTVRDAIFKICSNFSDVGLHNTHSKKNH